MITAYLSGTTALQALLYSLAYLTRRLASAEDSSPDWITRRTKAGACKWARKHNYVGCVDARVQFIYPEEPIKCHRTQPRPPRARRASEATFQELQDHHLVSWEQRAGLTGEEAIGGCLRDQPVNMWVHLRSASAQKILELD